VKKHQSGSLIWIFDFPDQNIKDSFHAINITGGAVLAARIPSLAPRAQLKKRMYS
jgi:hypothetical protein